MSTKRDEEFFSFKEGFALAAEAAAGIPERVPIFAQLHELIPQELGVPAGELYRSAELLVRGTFKVCGRYGVDVPSVDYDTYNIEAEALGQPMLYGDSHFLELYLKLH